MRGRWLRYHLAANDLRHRLRPLLQNLILMPEKRQAQNHEQSAEYEIGNCEKHQEAIFISVQARTMKVMFTTEAPRTQRKLEAKSEANLKNSIFHFSIK